MYAFDENFVGGEMIYQISLCLFFFYVSYIYVYLYFLIMYLLIASLFPATHPFILFHLM